MSTPKAGNGFVVCQNGFVAKGPTKQIFQKLNDFSSMRLTSRSARIPAAKAGPDRDRLGRCCGEAHSVSVAGTELKCRWRLSLAEPLRAVSLQSANTNGNVRLSRDAT
jgi:hypothetical protein